MVFGQIRKSVSAEVNYGIRFQSREEAEEFLKELCKEVHSRLEEINMKTKFVTLKLMVSDFKYKIIYKYKHLYVSGIKK